MKGNIFFDLNKWMKINISRVIVGIVKKILNKIIM